MKYKLIPVNFNAYELPQFKESKKGRWYEYGTAKPYRNTYPDYLTYLYDKSSKQSQIINSKVKFIVGQGWALEGDLSFSERAQLEGFLRMANEFDSANELLNKLAKDKKVYGGFCIGVRMGANGKIAALDHIDFADIRLGVEGDYYFTEDWSVRDPETNEDFKTLKAFPFDDTANANQDYIIYYKEYRPDLGIYPLPDYVSAINYLESDISISTFTLNNIKNNLSAGYIISFRNGEPTDEEMRDIERRFKDYATGEGRAGQPLLAFGDADAAGPEILPIPTNGQDDRFIQLNEQIREEIFTAHGITSPTLVGIRQQNGLSNNADEIAVASQLFQNLHIKPEQMVFEQVFNELMAFNGLPKALTIVPMQPVERGLSEAAVLQAMSTEELREKIGLPPLEVEVNKNVEALNMLNPLLATKVLENMSVEEIRNLIGLSGTVTRTTEVLKKQFTDVEDEILFEQLNNTGFSVDEFETLETYQKPITCIADAKNFESEILQNFNFAINRVLTDVEKNVLDIIKDNPKIPLTEISKALNLPIDTVNETIQTLQDAKALDRNFEPTPEAKETIQEPAEETFIVYKYVKNKIAKGPDILPDGRTRPFCVKMLQLNRLYTLPQLETLTNDFGQTGIDIFVKRGGWWHNSETGKTTPYCRHIWEMQIVKRKK